MERESQAVENETRSAETKAEIGSPVSQTSDTSGPPVGWSSGWRLTVWLWWQDMRERTGRLVRWHRCEMEWCLSLAFWCTQGFCWGHCGERGKVYGETKPK